MGQKVDKEEYVRIKTISILIDMLRVFPEKWKSQNELCYLMDCELKGDMKAWEWQAF